VAISNPGNQSTTGNLLGIIMLSIVLSMPSNVALAASPCLILAIRVSSIIGALKERFYKRRIYLQILKTPKEKIVEVREFSVQRSDTPHVFSYGICGI
jgi:hypothetical protein